VPGKYHFVRTGSDRGTILQPAGWGPAVFCLFKKMLYLTTSTPPEEGRKWAKMGQNQVMFAYCLLKKSDLTSNTLEISFL